MNAQSKVARKVPARQSIYLMANPDKSGFEMRMVEHQLVVKERLSRQAGRVLAGVILIGLAVFLALSLDIVGLGQRARGLLLLGFPFALMTMCVYFVFLTWQILVMNRRLSGIVMRRRTRHKARQKRPFAYLLTHNNGILAAVWFGLAVVLVLLVADAVMLWNTNLTASASLLPRLSLLRLDPVAGLVLLKTVSIAAAFLYFAVVAFLWFRQTIVYFWADDGVAWQK